jgi:hypothetical protein
VNVYGKEGWIMEEAVEEVKWEEWAIFKATDLFTEHVQSQLDKLTLLQELFYSTDIVSSGLTEEYGRRVTNGIYEILDEATSGLTKYKEIIHELVENERPIRLAYRKKEDERKAKENLDPEKLERMAETLSLEAEKFRTTAEEVRAEATGEEVSANE